MTIEREKKSCVAQIVEKSNSPYLLFSPILPEIYVSSIPNPPASLFSFAPHPFRSSTYHVFLNPPNLRSDPRG